jgi:hypothetical protein
MPLAASGLRSIAFHSPAFDAEASIIATMPRRTASGSVCHAVTTACRSASRGSPAAASPTVAFRAEGFLLLPNLLPRL